MFKPPARMLFFPVPIEDFLAADGCRRAVIFSHPIPQLPLQGMVIANLRILQRVRMKLMKLSITN
jgi:hypothetical protein